MSDKETGTYNRYKKESETKKNWSKRQRRRIREGKEKLKEK